MFSHRLKELRKSRSWTQRELAEILHVSQQTIGSWEVGRAFPDEETVNVIADTFGVSIDYLYGRESNSLNDTVDLEKIVEDKIKMTYASEELDEDELESIRQVLKGALWRKMKKKESGADE